MCMVSTRFRPDLRRDTHGIHVAIIAVIVVIALVLLAIAVYAWSSADRLDAGVDPDDAYAVVQVDTKVGDFDNQMGKVEARDVDFKVTTEKVEHDNWFSTLSLEPGFLGWLSDTFDLTLTVRCIGPDGFEARAKETQKVQVDEWTWGKTTVNFNSFRFFVPKKGDYTLTAELVVDSEDEGVEDEVAWSQTKKVTVEVW